MEEIGEGFERLSKHAAFRRPVGAINGCHIGDPALGQCYYNRKPPPSIILQVVHDHIFWGGFPRSVHDSRILKNILKVIPPNLAFPFFLKEPICLITLCKEPLRGIVEACFIQHYAKARSITERASEEPLVSNMSACFDGLPDICHWRAALTITLDLNKNIFKCLKTKQGSKPV